MKNMNSKTYKVICTLCLTASLMACSELKDDSHYDNSQSVISNAELKIVSESSEDYLKGRPDLSGMTSLFSNQGIFDELNRKGQLSTLLVVSNEHFREPSEKVAFVTRSHISDISISPSNLSDGTRLMMWHGKYVNVSIDEAGRQGTIVDHIRFNNGIVKEVIKTATGYIYVISEMIETPTSLYDYITDLGADYSIFRELVMASSGKVFDRANSKAIGINAQGNTIYDSVFIYRNTFFENVGFDMNSESLTATMLLFSNDVINAAMEEAHNRLSMWNMERSDSIIKSWILKTAFFNQKYTAEQMQTTDIQDLTSIFGTKWRTNIQQVDTDNPVSLSNGIAYKVKYLHLPNNVLMYRLKDYLYYYENCTDEEKQSYFKTENLVFKECNTEVTAWTPLSGVWPLHENRIIRFDKASGVKDEDGFRLDFTLLKLNSNGTVTPWLIPPGSYRLAIGSVQNANLDIYVTVMHEGQEIAKSEKITLGTTTAYHYDRGTTLPDTYPEGYDPTVVREIGGNSKAGNYDTDGGMAINEVTIPDIYGGGKPIEVTLRYDCDNWDGKTNIKLYHWCLRPTVNNY